MTIHHSGTFIEAVENLNHFSGLEEFNAPILVSSIENSIIDGVPVHYQQFKWSTGNMHALSEETLRENCKVILDNVARLCQQDGVTFSTSEVDEGVCLALQLLESVGRKIKKEIKIQTLPEYQALQQLYADRFAGRPPESQYFLLHSLSSSSTRSMRSSNQMMQELATLEGVESDLFYEFFFMRQKGGLTWYKPELLRTLKLIADLDIFNHTPDSPLTQLDSWKNQRAQRYSYYLINSVRPSLREFYRLFQKNREDDAAQNLSKALMALMLAGNPAHLQLENIPPKTATRYFADFQFYFDEALASLACQTDIDKNTSSRITAFTGYLLDLLAFSFFTAPPYYHLLKDKLTPFIDSSSSKNLVVSLWKEYQNIQKTLGIHPGGPLVKASEIAFENTTYRGDGFYPLLQQNLPCRLFELTYNEKTLQCLHLPSPTYQYSADKAFISDTFKAFLHYLKEQKQRHLVFNLQDRTSWREHSRCFALEALAASSESYDALSTVGFAKNTDFYHQEENFATMSSTSNFIENLCKELDLEHNGFYFSPDLRQTLSPKLIKTMALAIGRIFFESKNTLNKQERLDFIELFYLFLQIKIISHVEPATFSLTSKDSLDLGSTAATQLFLGLHLLIGDKKNNKEALTTASLLLYTPVLALRERNLLAGRVQRMLSALGTLEEFIAKVPQREKRLALLTHANNALLDPAWSKAILTYRGC